MKRSLCIASFAISCLALCLVLAHIFLSPAYLAASSASAAPVVPIASATPSAPATQEERIALYQKLLFEGYATPKNADGWFAPLATDYFATLEDLAATFGLAYSFQEEGIFPDRPTANTTQASAYIGSAAINYFIFKNNTSLRGDKTGKFMSAYIDADKGTAQERALAMVCLYADTERLHQIFFNPDGTVPDDMLDCLVAIFEPLFEQAWAQRGKEIYDPLKIYSITLASSKNENMLHLYIVAKR